MTNTISLLLYGASFTKAVTLKSTSYSAESALVKLEETTQVFQACLCFRYKDGSPDLDDADPDSVPDLATNPYSKIEEGGFIVEPNAEGNCVADEIRQFLWDEDGDPTNGLEINTQHNLYADVANQSCLYKLWMCSCWASVTKGCLCASKNADESVTMIKPLMGGCPAGSGPLLNPSGGEAGGYALQCAPNPCLACCSCGQGICSGTGDPNDNDPGYADENCCDCCGAGGGYTCGLGPSGGFGNGGGGCCSGCPGGSGGGGGYGGSGGRGGRGGGGSGGGCQIKQNVNTDGGCC